MPTLNEVRSELRKSEVSEIFSRKLLALGFFGVIAVVAALLSPKLIETTPSGTYIIKQAVGTGTMTAYTTPGMFIQGFGDVFRYRASDIFYFSKHENEGTDESIEVRFNDGATARVSGNVRIELPADPQKLLDIHSKFRSYNALIQDTIEQVVSESVILTSALMSAEESYTTKRAEFSQMADDQVKNGVYLTEADTVETKDSKTGEVTKKQIVRVQKNDDGSIDRKPSVLSQYGIRVTQFVIKEIDYEEGVDQQINTKQQALMKTVSAKAEAEKAQQDRLTAEEVGKKDVAVARYQQEVEKAKAITAAEKELEVARLGKIKAEFQKQTKILEAEGEGEYRRKIMVADGALAQKLAAYVETQKLWAEAFANVKQPIVPSVSMGGGNGTTNNAATNLMELLGIKAARDLALDVKPAATPAK